jgi:hypothetical protein
MASTGKDVDELYIRQHLSTGRIYIEDDVHGVVRRSARLNPTAEPLQLLTPRFIIQSIIHETPQNITFSQIVRDAITPCNLTPQFIAMEVEEYDADEEEFRVIGSDSDSDYSWDDAINSLPIAHTNLDDLHVAKNILKTQLNKLSTRIDGITLMLIAADIDDAINMHDINAIAYGLGTYY